jgi:hypothetical protein
MKHFLSIFLIFSYCHLFAQEAGVDTSWKKVVRDLNYFINEKGDTIRSNGKAVGRVIIVSPGSLSGKKRDNSTWDNTWQNHVDETVLKIAEKMIANDTSSGKLKYEVVLDFSINEDSSIKELKIACKPENSFIVSECRKMVMSAPKKTPEYKAGKYVRTHITQPLSIKIR